MIRFFYILLVCSAVIAILGIYSAVTKSEHTIGFILAAISGLCTVTACIIGIRQQKKQPD